MVRATKKELPNTFADVDVNDITVSLPVGITRADSGLDNDKFASDNKEDVTLRSGCPLSKLRSLKNDDRFPLVIKVITPSDVEVGR